MNNPDSESARDFFDSVHNTMKVRHDWRMLALDESYSKAQELPEPQKSITLEKISAERERVMRIWELSEGFEADFRRDMSNKEMREQFIELSNDTRSRHLEIIDLMSQKLTQIISYAQWKVELNRSIMPFFTTDSPLVIYPLAEPVNDEPLVHNNYELCKLGLVDFLDIQSTYPPYVLYFPLNPQLMLSIASTLEHDVVFDSVSVLKFQYLQCMQAHDELYSHEGTGFMMADRAFAAEKEIRAALGLQFRQDWT